MSSADQPTTPRLVRAGPVAKYLGISRARCYLLAREKILPSVRLGRSVYFDTEEILRFIQENGRGWQHGWRKTEGAQ